MRLIASMIVRNELDRYLPLALEHLLTFCDEIRVLDDWSDDGTFEWLAEQPGVQVARHAGPTFYEYESKARNELLRWTLEGRPTYVLSIDADEFVGNPDAVRNAISQGGPVYTLGMAEVWQANDSILAIRNDGMWKPRLCPILWKAPRLMSSEWEVLDRKLACGREPMMVRRQRHIAASGSDVFHFGWANRSEREARAARYEEHDKGNFHNDHHLQSILWPDDRVKCIPWSWPVGLEGIKHDLVVRSSR